MATARALIKAFRKYRRHSGAAGISVLVVAVVCSMRVYQPRPKHYPRHSGVAGISVLAVAVVCSRRMLGVMEKGGYVFTLASKGRRLYTGVTSQLGIRVQQHKSRKAPSSFTARYNIDRLVWYQGFESIGEAITRESQTKNLHRIDKVALIVISNPDWKDLSEPWGKPAPAFSEQAMRIHEHFGGGPQEPATAKANTEILTSSE